MKKRRRAQGEGSVFKRWDSQLHRYQWIAQITFKDGKQKQFRVKSEAEGVKLLRKLHREIEEGLMINRTMTVREYLEYWIEEVHKPTIKISSYIKYRKLIRTHILPQLGSIRLEQLSPQMVQKFYVQKLQALSPKTIRDIHGVLHRALQTAVDWKMLAWNVCDVVRPPRLGRAKRKALSLEEVHRLLEAARGHRLEPMIILALVTGMRRGELLALTWGDIDWKARSVEVCKTVEYFPHVGYVEDEPKTEAGKRHIILPVFAMELLKQHRAKQEEAKRVQSSKWQDHDLVFPNQRGGYLSPRYVEKTFGRLAKTAGLKVTFHSLRHTASTLLRSMGVDIKVIQAMLGHSSIQVTADIYSHVFPEMLGKAAEQWDLLWHQTTPQTDTQTDTEQTDHSEGR
uniref:Site-specific integrase n=1 Tax=Thermogemmatispora argillosa TaxID=2045280 RepID=A0A455T7I0_9CHLR|nr:site-specific integrase [Thermogemmatispora argillosa]